MEILIQTLGWIGMILIVLAYFLISRHYVTAKSRVYQLMNLFGSVGVGINVFHQQAWPSVALQIVWIAISILALTNHK